MSVDICGCLVTKSFSTFETPWTAACQAPLSMGFFKQEYCSGLPFPLPEDRPNPGIQPTSQTRIFCIAGGFFTAEPPGKPCPWRQRRTRYWASLVAQLIKNPPAMQETPVRFRKIPWRREWLCTPAFLPRKLHGQRSLAACSL